jgi:hypothetical protein
MRIAKTSVNVRNSIPGSFLLARLIADDPVRCARIIAEKNIRLEQQHELTGGIQ